MNSCAKKMILVEYSGDSTNYRVYDPVSKQVSVSMDVTFSERVGETVTILEESQDDVLPKSSAEEDDENIHQEIEVIPHNVDHHQQDAVDEREASTRS